MTSSGRRTRKDDLIPWLAAAVALATAYAMVIAATGGFTVQIAGFRVRSRAWERPALLALGGAFVLALIAQARVAAIARTLRITDTARFDRALAVIAAMWTLTAGIYFGTFASGGADSYGYTAQAHLLLKGRLTDGIVAPDRFKWPDVERTLTPLGFVPGTAPGIIAPQYPPGLPLLLAPLAALSERAMYLVVPLFGALFVWLTFRLGVLLESSTIGALAAVLLACNPTVLYQVVQPMSDIPAAACWLAALIVSVRGTARGATGAGAIASLAVLIRPNLAPLVVLIAAGSILSGPVAGRTRRLWLFLASLAPGILVLGWIQDARYGSPLASGYGKLSEGFSARNIAPNLSRYPRWLTETQTWFVWLSLAAPLWILRRARAPLLSWLALILAAAVWCAYLPYAYFHLNEWHYTRFLLAALAVMLVFASGVAWWVLQPLPAGSRTLVALVLLAGLAATELGAARTHGAFALRAQERKYPDAGAFVRDRLPASAFVLAAQHSGSIRYYTGRQTLRWDLLAPSYLDDAVAALRASGYTPFLVVDASELDAFRDRFAAQRAAHHLAPLAVIEDTRVFAFEDSAALGRRLSDGERPFEQQDRQVVGEPRSPGVFLDSFQHPGANRGRLLVGMALDHELEARLFEWLALGVLRLGDAVAVQHEHLPRLQGRIHRAEDRMLEHAERDAGPAQPLVSAVEPSDQGRILSRVHIRQRAGPGRIHRIEQGDEP
jgi:hypothetical protein